MNNNIKVAITFTIILVILYFVSAIIVIKILNLPFLGLNLADCTFKMALSNKCMCPDNLDFSTCKPTGQIWKKSPKECKICPNIKMPIGLIIINTLFGIFLILTVLSWINVFTKTVKF